MKVRLLETLQYIHDYQQKHLNSPSLKGVADKLGVTDAAISLRIKQLEKEEAIERLGNRALRITQTGYDILGQTTTTLD